MATEKNFEQSIKRLEEIVRLLESGEVSLDESIKLFEEGTALTAFCSQSLRTAEQKIVKLTAVEKVVQVSEAAQEEQP